MRARFAGELKSSPVPVMTIRPDRSVTPGETSCRLRRRGAPMASYVTVREDTFRFGTNGYVEVARKRLVEEGVASEFVLLTRGFVDSDGRKRWTRFVTLPADPEMVGWLAEALRRAALPE